jgi:hypothetical protein
VLYQLSYTHHARRYPWSTPAGSEYTHRPGSPSRRAVRQSEAAASRAAMARAVSLSGPGGATNIAAR